MEWILWIRVLPVLLFSVVIHECAHGYIASRCGDDTARYAGRITLNPIPHIDPFGSVLLPLLLIFTGSRFLIAWAKPVPVNPANFRHPGRDDILVSLAGPCSNVVLAFLFTFVAILGQAMMRIHSLPTILAQSVVFLAQYGILINLLLAVFNLIPIPPLDGSHILRHLLPHRAVVEFDRISRYGFLILLILVMTPVFRFIFLPAHVLFWLLMRLVSVIA
jgi:Zn-dependent protease